MDWVEKYQSSGRTRAPVTQFLNGELDLRVHAVQGPEWLALLAQVRAGPSDGRGGRRLYFDQHYPLLAGRRGVAMIQDGPKRHYLWMTQESLSYLPSDHTIPLRLVMPYLLYGIAACAIALLAYVLLRWKAEPGSARYKWWVWLPMDFIGFLLCGSVAFVAGQGAARVPLEAVGVAAGGLLLGQVMLVPAMYYVSLRAIALSDRVRITSLFGTRDFAYTDISSAAITRESQSPVVGVLLILVGLTNCVMIIAGIVLLVRKDLRFTLIRNDGKKVGFWVRSTQGLEDGLLPALNQAGVEVGRYG